MAEFIQNPKNSYLFGALALFVTVYGPRLSPKLPKPIQDLFENGFFRAAVMFIAIYVAQRDIKVALVVTIVFMVLMNVVQNTNVFESFLQNYERSIENFQDLTDSQQKCKSTLVQSGQAANSNTDSSVPAGTVKIHHGGTQYSDYNWSGNVTTQADSPGKGVQGIVDWCKTTQKGSIGSHNTVNSAGYGVPQACDAIVRDCDGKFTGGGYGPGSLPAQLQANPVCSTLQKKPDWTLQKISNEKVGDTQKYGDQTVTCVQQAYGSGCKPHPDSMLLKKSATSAGSGDIRTNTKTPSGRCIKDSDVDSPTGDLENSCLHSGQCCNYQGANKPGSRCVKLPGGQGPYEPGFGVCVNPQPDAKKDPRPLGDYKYLKNANLTWDESTGLSGPSNYLPNVPHNWGTNIDGSNFPNDGDVKFGQLFTDTQGATIGRGCWAIESGGITPESAASQGNFDSNLTNLSSGDTPSNTASLSQAYSSPSTLQNIPIRGNQQATTSLNIPQGDGASTHNIENFVGSRNADFHSQLNQTNQISGAPVSNCGNYNPKSVNFTGTAWYPLNDTNQYQSKRGKDYLILIRRYLMKVSYTNFIDVNI